MFYPEKVTTIGLNNEDTISFHSENKLSDYDTFLLNIVSTVYTNKPFLRMDIEKSYKNAI